MRSARLVSALGSLSLLFTFGLGPALAQGADPNVISKNVDDVVVAGVLPVIAGGGSDTIFFLVSTAASTFHGSAISSDNPVRVRVQLYTTAGVLSQETVQALTGTGGGQFGILTASGTLSASSNGVAVITTSTSAGVDTSDMVAGSAFYVDANFGTTTIYERPLILGRGSSSQWPAFAPIHVASYIEMAGFTTRLHILCPSSASSDSTSVSALTDRVNDLGTFPKTGSGITGHYDMFVFDSSGSLKGTVFGISCRGVNFQNKKATEITSFFSSGVGGVFTIVGSTGSTHAVDESQGDLIVWRTIGVTIGSNVLALDERAHIKGND